MKPWYLYSLLLTQAFVFDDIQAVEVQERCEPKPMARPKVLADWLRMPLLSAQQLSDSAKAKLGIKLLLLSHNQPPLVQAYLDYYLAQMYAPNDEHMAYRVELLTSALNTKVLYGAERQDALYSLSQLHLKLGNLAKYQAFLSKWQAISCQTQFAEAVATVPTESNPAAKSNSSAGAMESQSQTFVKATGTQAPKLLQYIEPSYPADAYRDDISGYVSLAFTITRDGFVTDVRVTDSEPELLFDRVALEAVRQWLFRPMLVDGKPVQKLEHKVRLEFDIQSEQ